MFAVKLVKTTKEMGLEPFVRLREPARDSLFPILHKGNNAHSRNLSSGTNSISLYVSVLYARYEAKIFLFVRFEGELCTYAELYNKTYFVTKLPNLLSQYKTMKTYSTLQC